jgi:hypothetical protein
MARKAKWDPNDFVSVDTEAVEQKMKDLEMTQPEIRKSLRSAIRQSLNIVRSGVRKGAATVTSNREKRQKGVGLVVYKNGSGGQVNIYTPFQLSKSTGRGIFILRWLEEGTKEGIGRNGRKHGATPAKPFFNAAVSASVGKAEQTLSDNILQSIEKVASKRK